MNNSEGQTQEPVGGMKSPQKFLETFEGFDFDEAFTDHELGQITNAMSAYHKYATPPPSPVGIDVEALAKSKVDEMMGYGKYNDNWDYADKHEREKLISVFKAGYSASLPQSSTEEEKDAWERSLNFFQGEYMLKPFTTKEEVITELMSTYKISKR